MKSAQKPIGSPQKRRGTIATGDQSQFTLSAYPEFMQLLGTILKWDRVSALRYLIAKEVAESSRFIDRILPSANLLQFSTSENLQIENLNVFFWKALLQRGVQSKRASDTGLNVKNAAQGNEFMSKAEKELKQLVVDLGLHIHSEENLLKNPLKAATPVEIGVRFFSQMKLVRTQDVTPEEEGCFPKLEVNDISFWGESSGHDASEPELVGSNSLSRLLGAVQQKRKKDRLVTKNAGEDALIEEVRVLGKNHCKNISYYLLDEVTKSFKKQTKVSSENAGDTHSISPQEILKKIFEKVPSIKFRLTASKSKQLLLCRNPVR